MVLFFSALIYFTLPTWSPFKHLTVSNKTDMVGVRQLQCPFQIQSSSSTSCSTFLERVCEERVNMKASFFFLICLVSFLKHSQPLSTTVVDGVAEWKSPTSLQVGDSLVFKHKHLHNLYLFHDRRAFDRCNFAQASLVYKGTSTHFTWSPSRPGYYYFSTRDNCDKGEKVPVRVISTTPADLYPAFPPVPLPAPPPTSGGESSASPSSSHGWGWVSSSPSSPGPAPDSTSPLVPKEGTPSSALAPAGAPESGGGIPFLNSNPAVPLPTGMTDTASIRPLPTPGDGSQAVGLGSSSVRIEKWLLEFVMMCSVMGLWM